MRKFAFLLVSVAGLTVWGAGAIADPVQTSPAVAPAATTVSDADKTVCKTMPPPTGTRLGSRRECHTQSQWDDIRRQARQETEHQQDNGFRTAIPGG